MKLKLFKLLFLAVVLSVLGPAGFASAAWNEPTQPPPSGNTPEPINVSESTQNKSGRLGVGALSVFGDLLIPSGSGSGKVLTSDSTGRATWQTVSELTQIINNNPPAPTGDSFWSKRLSATGNFLIPIAQSDHLGLWPQTNIGSGKNYGCSGCNATNNIQLYNSGGNMNFSVGGAANKFIFSGGPLQITAGNPGAGKVLTSDASGNASWQAPASTGGSGPSTPPPSSGDSFPAGTVVMTRNSSCPSGWFEPGEFAGRFIIGADLSHPPGTTTGTPRFGPNYSYTQDAQGLPLAGQIGTPAGVGLLHSHEVPSISLRFCVKQ